jgi:hypothetical protein
MCIMKSKDLTNKHLFCTTTPQTHFTGVKLHSLQL